MFEHLQYAVAPILVTLICIFAGIYLDLKLLQFISILWLIFILFFFRSNLSLNVEQLDDSDWISPSSSKVTNIDTSKRDLNKITTYLSPLDRHFQIIPIDSVVVEIRRLNKDSCRLNNSDAERLRITLRNVKDGRIYHLDQIVTYWGYGGYLLKLFYPYRCLIFPHIKPGTFLKRGTKYGLIRFGSNMEYWLPKNYVLSPKVKAKRHFELGNKFATIPNPTC